MVNKNYHIVCQDWKFNYFQEYLNSFKDKLNFDYVLLKDMQNYNYSDDPNEI